MIVRKDMSLSRAALECGMARLRARPEGGQGDDALRWRIGEGRIRAVALPALQRGALRLERWRLLLDLSALAEPEAKGFLRRFEQTFFRGGG